MSALSCRTTNRLQRVLCSSKGVVLLLCSGDLRTWSSSRTRLRKGVSLNLCSTASRHPHCTVHILLNQRASHVEAIGSSRDWRTCLPNPLPASPTLRPVSFLASFYYRSYGSKYNDSNFGGYRFHRKQKACQAIDILIKESPKAKFQARTPRSQSQISFLSQKSLLSRCRLNGVWISAPSMSAIWRKRQQRKLM